MKFFARYKQSWSKPVDEDYITNHLSTDDSGDILCGIDKRHKDIYHYGADPLINVDADEIMICKNCFKIYKKVISNVG